MVGCMLNSRGIYQGYRVAFDVATGVVPEHRGKQVFAGLFALARQTMKQYQIQRYYLEVLQQNIPAISLYQRHGFSITREFVVFSASASSESQVPEEVQFTALTVFDFSETVPHKPWQRPPYSLLYSRRILSAINAINSEFVGFPFDVLTV